MGHFLEVRGISSQVIMLLGLNLTVLTVFIFYLQLTSLLFISITIILIKIDCFPFCRNHGPLPHFRALCCRKRRILTSVFTHDRAFLLQEHWRTWAFVSRFSIWAFSYLFIIWVTSSNHLTHDFDFSSVLDITVAFVEWIRPLCQAFKVVESITTDIIQRHVRTFYDLLDTKYWIFCLHWFLRNHCHLVLSLTDCEL